MELFPALLAEEPIAIEDCPYAVACRSDVVLELPMAILLVPCAFVLSPIEILRSPTAVAAGPAAIAFSPVAPVLSWLSDSLELTL